MKIFLSYSHEDKALASQLKASLEDLFGADVFLAHEDIQPLSEWQKVIIKELKACHVLLPLITADFYSSSWTDQEVGFALARGIPIIPINAGQIPSGFIAKYQALKLDVSDIQNTCLAIANVIVLRRRVREIFLDKVIENFGDSDSFAKAEKTARIVVSLKTAYTTHQKNNIVGLAAANAQIYHCFAARRVLSDFINESSPELNPKLVEAYREVARK